MTTLSSYPESYTAPPVAPDGPEYLLAKHADLVGSPDGNQRGVIYYHRCDWEGLRARQRYLMTALSAWVPVIFLDGGADGRGKITRYQPCPNVTVVRGMVSLIDKLQNRGAGFLGSVVARYALSGLTREWDRVIFWNAENWNRVYRYVRHDVMIHDCLDPSFDRDPDAEAAWWEREREVLSKAELVFGSAESLLDEMRKYHAKVFRLNNACAPEEYSVEYMQSAERPAWWPDDQRPVVGYLGSLDWRVDLDLLQATAARCPEVRFVLAGRVIPEVSEACSEIDRLENVSVVGPVSVEDGRYLLQNCGVGIIPFRVCAMNDAINPVKLYAYSLLGKPIVGTTVRELRERADVVYTANEPEAFAQAIRRALDESEDPQVVARQQRFAMENTWDHRAVDAWAQLRSL
ncbi:MAG: glycosyltransferase [Planctomycetota bacterium]